MDKKLIVTEKINKILDKKGITAYKLSQLMQVTDSALYQMIKGKTPFSEKFIGKILPHIKVKKEEFESWILADKYSKEVLELAIRFKKEKQDDKLILTAKLDEILQSRQLSRTALSKLIKYSQGGLNEMIIGKEPMSKSVISKISVAFNIPENEIKSWIVADKYPLQILESALKIS